MICLGSNVHELIIGYGTFGSEVRTADRFGLPVGIKAGGIGLDIPISKVIVADHNDRQNFLNYRMQAGMIASSLEHQTPEQLYNTDPNNPIQGISTMKAFALANAQGQKMYTISKQNIDKVLPMIQASALTKGDIRNAVYAGKIVTVHEREVSVPGWHGTGYMVFDPANGNNAFMISGGGNGGWIETAIAVVLDVMRPAVLPTAIIAILMSVYSALDALKKCDTIHQAIYGLMLGAFVAYMTYIMIMASAAGVGLFYLSSFAAVMEIIFGDMLTGIAESC